MAISKLKLILVIGATGAQGQAVINSLSADRSDGSQSRYTIRALTRDSSSPRAQALAARGVEVVEGESTIARYHELCLERSGWPGSVDDLASISYAFRGVYGAWVNTDGFTIVLAAIHLLEASFLRSKNYSGQLPRRDMPWLTLKA